jgi:uncharacterized FlaG/YvyC family protein
MPVILNKIDPVIVNTVHQQTVEGVVHSYEKTKVSKDKEKRRESSSSNRNMKDKLDGFNSLLEVMDIGVNFIFNDDTITAVDKDGNVLKTYTKDAVIELFESMEDMIGIFIDTKR